MKIDPEEFKIEPTHGENEMCCMNCYHNTQKGTCSLLNIVPMSKDGRGKTDCEKWEPEAHQVI